MNNQAKEDLIFKNHVLKVIRNYLLEQEYLEVNTPIIRKAGDNSFLNRLNVSMKISDTENRHGFLRDSIEFPLRSLLQYHDKVFEIGSCFRTEVLDATHNSEFLMLELFAENNTLNDMMNLVINIISNIIGKKIEYQVFSVKDAFLNLLNIDISVTKDYDLKQKIIEFNYERYHDYDKDKPFVVVNKFISDNMENKNGFYFLIDYPACTISTAKRKENSNIIERFELFYNRLEIANSFVDECNIHDLIERSIENGLYGLEEKMLVSLLTNNMITKNSSGLGIGIERLCMVLKEQPICNFIFSKEFSFNS